MPSNFPSRCVSQTKNGEWTIGKMICWQRPYANFHIADSVGGGVDKQFIETILYDRLLRLVRRHFAFWTGDIILRGVATKFSNAAQMFDAQPEDLTHIVAGAEAPTPSFGGRAACKACAGVWSRGRCFASRWMDKVVATTSAKGRWHTANGMADTSTRQILPVVRIGVCSSTGI